MADEKNVDVVPEEKVELEDKKKLLEDEVEAAFEEELGHDWLAEKDTPYRIAVQFARLFLVFLSLYFFLVALSLMGSSFSALSGKGAGGLFVGNDSPIVGLMIGILATVLVQSSSTTTSIIVTLVASGLVEVQTAIPMIMGANIGTSVTNTIVSLGFADDSEAYKRGFAGATVHDMFNYLNVALFLPLELLIQVINPKEVGLLQAISEAVFSVRGERELENGQSFKDANPIKKITNPILKKIIDINKDVIEDAAKGFPPVLEDGQECPEEGSSFKFENKKAESALESIPGCVAEDRECDFCETGFFNLTTFNSVQVVFDEARLVKGGRLEDLDDRQAGIVALVLSLVLLIGSLAVVVRTLTAIVQGSAKKILIRTLNYNFVGGGYLAILVGCGLTFIVQSSSITTSILTPLVAVDALTVENMFPFTLGANIGTTGTGLISAATNGAQAGYEIALVHFFFNLLGTFFWYPVPLLRNIPVSAAKFLGEMASIWKVVPIIYILTVFIIYPLIFFGISSGFRGEGAGGKAVAALGLIALLGAHAYAVFWYRKRDGKNKFIAFVDARKQRLAEKRGTREAADVSV